MIVFKGFKLINNKKFVLFNVMHICFFQIGSYYGSEIAPLDIDGDGITDNLLVAAPMFFSGGLEKGKVYIYRVTELVGINYKNKYREKDTYRD